MKHFKYIFLIGMLGIFSACDSEKDLVVVEPVEKIANVYGLGIIFGWDSNSPEVISQNSEDTNLFITVKVIKYSEENKQFKFTIDKGNWDEVRYLVPTNVDYGESVKMVVDGEYPIFQCSEKTGDLRDHFWGIPEGEDGTYRLTVNPKALTLKVEKLNSNVDEL